MERPRRFMVIHITGLNEFKSGLNWRESPGIVSMFFFSLENVSFEFEMLPATRCFEIEGKKFY